MEILGNTHRKIVLWGAYGFANTGDELTLLVALQRLNREPRTQYTVLSPREEVTRWLFPSSSVSPFTSLDSTDKSITRRILKRIHIQENHLQRWLNILKQYENSRLEQKEWLDLIRNADELCLVGGGYLTSVFESLPNILPLVAAWKYGRHIRSRPIGLGPFRSNSAAKAFATILKNASLLVRDRDSLEFCQSNKIQAEMAPDDVLSIENIPKDKWCLTDGKVETRSQGVIKVGVNLNQQAGASGNSSWMLHAAECLRSLATFDSRFHFCGFGFYYREEEFETTCRVFRLAGLNTATIEPPQIDFRRNVGRLSTMDFIITSRFHAVVLSQVLKLPYVGVWNGEYYRTKMEAASGYGSTPGITVSSTELAQRATLTRIAHLLSQVFPKC